VRVGVDHSSDELGGEKTVATSSAPVRPTPELEVGARIDRYVVLERIGEGAMGVVYAAYDPRLDRKVAIKLLKPRREAGSRLARAALAREAQSMARLSHPNVVSVFDAGVCPTSEGETLYLAMEFVAGRSLRHVLAELHRTERWQAGRASRDIVALFVAAGHGLRAAHEAGIIHRDFKPHNVLVGDTGAVQVADFGLAEGLSTRPSLHPHEDDAFVIDDEGPSSTPMGTPAYMSPEQLAGESVDARADQYAFCIALHEALYGVRPFDGTTVAALLYQTTNGVVGRVPTTPRVPRRLRRIVLRGLAPDPEGRYPTMADLLADLEHDPRARLRALAPIFGLVAIVLAIVWAIWSATRPGAVEVAIVGTPGELRDLVVEVGPHRLTSADTTAAGEVPAGLHELRVHAQDHRTHVGLVDVPRGGSVLVEVVLEHEEGTVGLEVDPIGARILVDGRDYGARLSNMQIPTGTHRVEIQRIGHYDAAFDWLIARDTVHERYVSLAAAMVWSAPLTGINSQTNWVGDMTGDGRLEVIHRNFNNYIVYDPWGGRAWARHDGGERGIYTGTIADLDHDGIVELVKAGSLPHGEVAVHRFVERTSRASPWWRFTGAPGMRASEHRAEPAIIDADGDGIDDVVVVSPWAEHVLLLDGRTGRSTWSAPLESEAIAVQVLPMQPRDLVVVATRTAVEGFAARDGARVFSTAAPLVPSSRDDAIQLMSHRVLFGNPRRILVAELDGRPGPEFVVTADLEAVGATRLHAFANDGTALWVAPQDFRIDLPAGARRVDGDASDDFVGAIAGPSGTLTAVLSGRDGHVLWSADGAAQRWIEWPAGGVPHVGSVVMDRLFVRRGHDGHEVAAIDLPATPLDPPVVADLDRDGRSELVIALADATLAVYTSAESPPQRIRLAVPAEGLSAPVDANTDGFPDLVMDANGPTVITGPKTCWRRASADAVRAAPIAVDADGDGDLDIVSIGSYDDRGAAMHVFDGRTGHRIARSDNEVDDAIESIRTPAILVTHEGRLGVLATDFTRSRVGLWAASDGALLGAAIGLPVYATAGIWPMDDGAPAIAVVPWEKGPIVVLDSATWTERWRTDAGAGSWAQPRAIDVDGDGDHELLVADNNGGVRLYDVGVARPRWRVELGVAKHNAVPAHGDVDGDGELELLASTADDAADLVLLRARDGRELHRWAGLGSAKAPNVIADVDGDGRDDIFAASRTRVHRLGADGVLWSYVGGMDAWHDAIRPLGPLTVADLDGDGHTELIATFADGSLRVLDAKSGAFRWRFDTGSEAIEGGATVADVDGDGTSEVFVGSHSRYLYCLRSPRSDDGGP
jgi:outer membrane protein assembly factor BamB/tRNA A-37 threonylcarbamoyl transferase component Bud32